MKKCFLILLFILCISSQVLAADWYFAGGSSQVQAYIDNSSVRKNEREAIIWIKYIKPDGNYYLQETRFTRTPPTASILYVIFYDKKGEVISSFSTSPYERSPESLPPESIGDSIWHLIWPY